MTYDDRGPQGAGGGWPEDPDDGGWEPPRDPRPQPLGPHGEPLGRTGPRPPQRPPARMGGGGPRRGAGNRSRVLLGAAVTLLLVLGACGVWVQKQIDPGSPGEVQTITVPEGSSSSSIGDQLADAGVIKSAFIWDLYLKIKGGGPFQAGEYELAANSAMGDVISTLEEGPAPPEERRYTMPEGFTLDETLDRLADPDKGLGLDRAEMAQLLESGQIRSIYQPADQPSNEGILFPETYLVDDEAGAAAILQQMVDELDATLSGLDVDAAMEKYNLTPYEILITASLIEEETKVGEERAKVARVIYNRLKQGIPLGIDATSRYEAEVIRGDRDKLDFTSSSPYNTRRVKGLPPTPIAAPGRASLEAALNPADGPWIYYVLENADGRHFFTDSTQEFNAAKARCKANGLGCG